MVDDVDVTFDDEELEDDEESVFVDVGIVVANVRIKGFVTVGSILPRLFIVRGKRRINFDNVIIRFIHILIII